MSNYFNQFYKLQFRIRFPVSTKADTLLLGQSLIIAIMFLLASSVSNSLQAASGDLSLLGEKRIKCKKRELTILGVKRKKIPPGKYEWISVGVSNNFIRYACGSTRSYTICPIDTTLVKVRRDPWPGQYQLKCFGEPWGILPHSENDITTGELPGKAQPTTPVTPGQNK